MAGRLEGESAAVNGPDSGFGHARAMAFACGGADAAATVHTDREGAERTAEEVGGPGRRTPLIRLEQKDHRSVEELGTPKILEHDTGIDSTGNHVRAMDPAHRDREIWADLRGTTGRVDGELMQNLGQGT